MGLKNLYMILALKSTFYLNHFFMENLNQKNPYMKSKEVMELLGCSSGKLQTLRKNGTIEAIKIGGTYYYTREKIEGLFKY